MDDALLVVNMGGPATTGAVEPYLRAIFRDPLILPVPSFVRPLVSGLIVRRRAPAVAEKYDRIGGGSPLPAWTEKLVDRLAAAANAQGRPRRVAHAFRYTDPLIPETLADLAADGATRITLLPLFPHETQAMTGSVLAEARGAARDLQVELRPVPAFWRHAAVLDVQRGYLQRALAQAGDTARVLFVAHGIPRRDVDKDGPPTYPEQVAGNAEALAAELPAGATWRLAYQSRVGPVKWTGPYLEDALDELGQSPEPVVIFPLSFVADCLETLWDLDIEAVPALREAGVREVVRVPAYNDDADFAAALLRVVEEVERDG